MRLPCARVCDASSSFPASQPLFLARRAFPLDPGCFSRFARREAPDANRSLSTDLCARPGARATFFIENTASVHLSAAERRPPGDGRRCDADFSRGRPSGNAEINQTGPRSRSGAETKRALSGRGHLPFRGLFDRWRIISNSICGMNHAHSPMGLSIRSSRNGFKPAATNAPVQR